jgi:integrase
VPARKRPDNTGSIRQLPSRRWQARFCGPDGVFRPAPQTFDTRLDAAAWLASQTRDVQRGVWQPPERTGPDGRTTLAVYAWDWLDSRQLKPSTRWSYTLMLTNIVLPPLGQLDVDRLTPMTVRNWYAGLDPSKPTRRAHAYGLLRSIYTTAVADELVGSNPCRIRGAGTVKPRHRVRTASLAEVDGIVAAMPPRYRALILVAVWCGLRFGELAELRRGDLEVRRFGDRTTAHLRVERGVTRVDGRMVVGDPKSDAGRRNVAVPPHLIPVLLDHLATHVDQAWDALVFPGRGGQHLNPSALYKVYYPAREAVGRPDLRFHDLRHTGATLAAATGATLAELMARLGHSTPQAAMRYQHATTARDVAIADALSEFANGNVIPLRRSQPLEADNLTLP